ncbi:MAG: hypothetical protein ACK46O_14080 [Flavobacteriia bacterium]|jgi:hypothetical protein
MEEKRSYQLVDGNFNYTDATEVLFSLINSKIKFHDLQSFGKKERSEIDLHHSDRRSKELRKILEDIRTLIARAEKGGMHLSISGTIEITLTKPTANG